jgi:dCTP deaminase
MPRSHRSPGFWSPQTLRDKHQIAPLILTGDPSSPSPDFRSGQLDHAGYRLTMGPECYISPSSDQKKSSIYKLKDGEAFFIPSGQFAFLLTEELVHVPTDALAFIGLRSSIKMQGLVNVSGFHVDPGFKGRIVYAVYNAGPGDIHLRRGEELFMIMFADLDTPSEQPRQKTTENSSISTRLILPIAGKFLSLMGLQDSIGDLEDDVNERLVAMEREVALLRWAAAALMAILVAIVTKLYLK